MVPDAPEMPITSRRGALVVILDSLDDEVWRRGDRRRTASAGPGGIGLAGGQGREQDIHGAGREGARCRLFIRRYIGARRRFDRRFRRRRQVWRQRKQRLLLEPPGF